MNVISLISDINVAFVLTEGRVSLSNLIDFSNFVDLYILEDEIYCDETTIDVSYSTLKEMANFPFRPITNDNIQSHLWMISNNSRELYDLSPNNFTFSINSYDYWLSLDTLDKGKIDTSFYNKMPTDQENLMISSKIMEKNLFGLIDLLSKTDFSIMPSTRNLLPFLDTFYQIETPIFRLYNKISSEHKRYAEKLIEFQKPRTVYLPPLLSILLNRCDRASDIPKRMSELRDEFSGLRQEIFYWEAEMSNLHTFRDQLKLREELDNVLTRNSQNFKNRKLGFYKHVSGAFLEGFEDGITQKIFTKPAIALAKEGLDLFPDKIRSKKFSGLIKLFDESFKVEDYGSLLQKVFKKNLDISQYEVANVGKYFSKLKANYNIDLAAVS
jgi:hypothetical protein